MRLFPALSGLVLVPLLLLGGCTLSVGKVASLEDLEWPDGVLVEDVHVPDVLNRDMSCGTQALAAAILHHDRHADIDALLSFEPASEKGATVVELIHLARREGYEVSLHQGDWDLLAQALGAGNPPIVLYDAATDADQSLDALRDPTMGLPILRKPRSGGTPVRMHWGIVGLICEEPALIGISMPQGRVTLIDKEAFLDRWGASAFCTLLVEGTTPAQEAADSTSHGS